ncbi:hypothetical protein GCM10022239_05270 [Leifsonia bigeumensis]|uniref:Tripartite tricarboxylate transporter TctB family protein n=1 Tax=Leifsonella bigeumensis TaxID=433643 RepID=A0ABP7F5A3_9MICO
MPANRPSDPAPASGSFSRALLVAVMVTVLYGAILLAFDGFVSLLADRDVIQEQDAGPLVGPIMAVVALAIVFVSVLGGLRPTSARPAIPVARAVVTALLVYLLGPFAGAIVYVAGQEQLLTGVLFLARYLGSPFVIASAVLALLPVLLLPLIAIGRSRAR